MNIEKEIWDIVMDIIVDVLEEVETNQLTPITKLQDVGANSVDRMEIVTLSMEELDLTIPMTKFSHVRNIGGLVETLAAHQKLQFSTT